MGDAMVVAAQEGKVVQIGRAELLPMADMVGVAPAGGGVAAREHAAAVADGQGASLSWGGQAHAASEIEGHPE